MNNAGRWLVLFLLFNVFVPAHAERVIRITNGEWPPYLSERLPHYGVASHIVTAAFALQGITVQYGFFPWPRALALAKSGHWDGAAVWLRSEERERDFHISDPVVNSEYVFFHARETSFKWAKIADLAGYRIGITNDYFYGEEFQSAVKQGQLAVEGVASDEQNFRKLLGGRIDIFPMDKIVGRAMLAQHFSTPEINRLVMDSKPLYSQPLHLLINKKAPRNQQLMEEFNQGLQKLKASGQLDAYLKEVPKQQPATAISK